MSELSWKLSKFFTDEQALWVAIPEPPFNPLPGHYRGTNLDFLFRFSKYALYLFQSGNSSMQACVTKELLEELQKIYSCVYDAVERYEFEEKDISLIQTLPGLMGAISAYYEKEIVGSTALCRDLEEAKTRIMGTLEKLASDRNINAFLNLYEDESEPAQSNVISWGEAQANLTRRRYIASRLIRPGGVSSILSMWGDPPTLQQCKEKLSAIRKSKLHDERALEAIKSFNKGLRETLSPSGLGILNVLDGGAEAQPADNLEPTKLTLVR